MIELNKIYQHDVKEPLPLPDKFVNCCVTSPPYWGLRDYGESGQLGLEKTPEEYIQNMVKVFREVKRVLKDDGTLWVNIGDSYASGGRDTRDPGKSKLHKAYEGDTYSKGLRQPDPVGIKPKDLVGIPWMLAFALRADGWYLRQDIIWHKPNPMPESVTDRCTKAHEYIFLLSKNAKYYYDADAIKYESKDPADDIRRMSQQNGSNKSMPSDKVNGLRPKSWNGSTFDKGKTGEVMATRGGRKSGNIERKKGTERGCPEGTGSNVCGSVPWEGVKANKRSVWTVTTKPFKEAHFATFPEHLIVDCIKAGCPENGVVLDTFNGAGTTSLVSAKLNRNFIGFDISAKYIAMANKRLRDKLGMFNPAV